MEPVQKSQCLYSGLASLQRWRPGSTLFQLHTSSHNQSPPPETSVEKAEICCVFPQSIAADGCPHCYRVTSLTRPRAHRSPILSAWVIVKSKQSSHTRRKKLPFRSQSSLQKGRVIKSPLPLGSLLYRPSAQSQDLIFHFHYKSRAGKGRHTS